MRAIASFVLPADRRGTWPDEKEMDASFEYKDARFRVNAYFETRGPSFALRLVAKEIPSVQDLGLSQPVIDLMHQQHGLVLVTGPTGSGKSTTLASLVDYVNSNFEKHIITIEDPIEYVFESKKCLVHQREISVHTHSFARAIKSSLREDPDIIMIGEMRDPETMAAAITLAETGHLVLATLHTNDTIQSIDRIVDSFPSSQQPQIRVQLAMSLLGVVSQVLLPRKTGKGRVAAREILLNNDAIRSLIIHGSTHQIYSMVELGAQEGMVLMDRALETLYMK
jgi:twitching motility protein PilT